MRSVLPALLLLLPAMASATDVTGTLSTHTVWTRSGSPYVLKGDVTVAWGTKLIIEPGVRIIAAPEDALRSGVDPERVELIVDGTLVVRGTRSHPVELTARWGSWYGIRVRGGRGTVIDRAVITRAQQGISLGMSAVVRNTSVSATAEDCLHVSWGRATLEGNRLSGCGDNGLFVDTWAQRTGLFDARARGRTVFASPTRSPRGGAVASMDRHLHRGLGAPSSAGSVSPAPTRESPRLAHRTLPLPPAGPGDGTVSRRLPPSPDVPIAVLASIQGERAPPRPGPRTFPSYPLTPSPGQGASG